MRTDGYFTADERQAAIALGAIVAPLLFGQISLCFEGPARYEEWLAIQKERHPTRWANCVLVKSRRPAA